MRSVWVIRNKFLTIKKNSSIKNFKSIQNINWLKIIRLVDYFPTNKIEKQFLRKFCKLRKVNKICWIMGCILTLKFIRHVCLFQFSQKVNYNILCIFTHNSFQVPKCDIVWSRISNFQKCASEVIVTLILSCLQLLHVV